MNEILKLRMQCSRRILFAIFVSIFVVSSYIIYDYDSKVRVLLVSNTDYRRMTDNLNDRLETLKSELKQIRTSHEGVLSERDSTIRRMQEDSQRLDHALSEEKKMKESEDAELEKLSKSHQRQINELNKLRSRLDSLSQVSVKLHHCEGQYEALLRMYHSLSDNFQELQDNNIHMEASKISKFADPSGVLQPAKKSEPEDTSRISSPSQKSNLVVPKIPIAHDKKSSSTTPKSSSHVGIPGAPVGVEPPSAVRVHAPGEVKSKKDVVVESPISSNVIKKDSDKHNLDLNYFDRADDNDLNEDFNDDDTEYESYKRMNLKGPKLENERDDVVFHIQPNIQKKPIVINPVLYDNLQ